MNEQYTLIDVLNILSFLIGILNLEENLTQGDKQDLIDNLNKNSQKVLEQINTHLEEQDSKLNRIIDLLESKQ